MNFYLETSSNPITFNPNPFFLKPMFKFSLESCYLKLGNKTRTLKIWLTLNKNNVSESVNFTIVVGTHYFKDSSSIEIIQSITLADESVLLLPINLVRDLDIVKVNIKYSYLMEQAYDALVLYRTKLDNEAEKEDMQMISDVESIITFDFLVPQILKIRLNDGEIQHNVYEIKDGLVSRSNLIGIVNADNDIISFETKPFPNPYGLTAYTFEIVDQNDEVVNIDRFSGILKLVRL